MLKSHSQHRNAKVYAVLKASHLANRKDVRQTSHGSTPFTFHPLYFPLPQRLGAPLLHERRPQEAHFLFLGWR